MTPAEREHVDGLPIWECPCVECLHLDYEAGEQIETFYDFARRERADRLPPQIDCRYFALCDRSADGIVRHPILGDVPTCRRCAERVGAELVPAGGES